MACAYLQAFEHGAPEVQLQTWGDHLAVGRQLAAVDRRVVVKLPITRSGVDAAATLVAEGCRVTLTGQTLHAMEVSAPSVLQMTVQGIMRSCIAASCAFESIQEAPMLRCRPVLSTSGVHSCGDRRTLRCPLSRPHERRREAGLSDV